MQRLILRSRLVAWTRVDLDDLPMVAGVVAVILGLVALLGGLLELGWLGAPLTGSMAMDTDTAIAFVLLGLGLILAGPVSAPRGRQLAVVPVIGSLAIVALGALDPDRTAWVLAVCLLVIGCGIALAVVRRWWRLSAGLVLGVFIIAVLNALDLLFQTSAPDLLAGYGQMPFGAAVGLIALSVGSLGLLPVRGWLDAMTGPSASARTARRLVIASLVVPVVLAWLRLQGEARGLYGAHYGASLIVLGTFLFLTVMIVRTAHSSQRTEAAREAAIEERDRFFDMSLDLLATASASGRFVRLNPAWTAALGYELEELMARPFVDFVHPEDVEATNREVVRQIDEGRSVLNFQNRYRHRDGSYRWLEWTSAPSADGRMLYAIARDVTDRKREEERLHAPALALARRRAAARDRIETMVETAAFGPVYQPVVDLATGQAVGYEALTRFGDGSPPDEVFASARDCELGIELEMATLRAALADGAGLPARSWLSLNVSPALLADVSRLSSVLGLRARPVVLEITEHETIDAYGPLRDAVVRLGPGVRLAVDDAGAGVANFNHLVELRPDFVKIDVSLVHGVDGDLSRQAVMAGIVHFAAAARCHVIAEGVETEAELATIRELGVTLGQGYLIGRPAPAEEWRGGLVPAPRRSNVRRIQRSRSLPRAAG